MYTIGQFSIVCQVTPKALRHYEEIGLLKPAQIDPYNQYRYYAEEQVEVARRIRLARDTGMSLQRIKEILARDERNKSIDDILQAHRLELLDQMDQLNGRLTRLSWWQSGQEGISMQPKAKYDVILREIPAALVRSRRQALSDFPKGLGDLMNAVAGEIAGAGKVPAGPPCTLYYDEEFNPNRVDVEVAFPVSDKETATRTIPATLAATTVHVGSYNGLDQAYAAVYGWANANGYEPVLPMRDVYMNDPENVPQEHLVTEVILPVRRKA